MATYYVRSGGDTGSFTGSYASLKALTDAVTLTSADTVYVASDHENTAYAVNYDVPLPTTPGLKILCVNTSTLALTTGAIEKSGATYTYGVSGGFAYIYGITFKSGDAGTGSINLNINSVSTADTGLAFDQCTFWLGSTGGGSTVGLGVTAGTQNLTKLNNCKFKFSHAAQYVRPRGTIEMYGCSVDTSVVTPAIVFGAQAANAYLLMNGCDFSVASTAFWDVSKDDSRQTVLAVNCLMPSSITTGTHPGIGGNAIECHGCGTVTDDFAYAYYYQDGTGTITQDTSVYLTTGGATYKNTAGTAVPMSHKYVPTADCSKMFTLAMPWFNTYIGTTGSKTFSIKVAHTEAAVLKNNEIWIEVEYMGNAAHPQFTHDISAPVVLGTTSLDILAAGSNLTDTAEAWTGITSEKTHTLSKTVTVNQIGFARARVVLAKQTTNPVYVDPQVVIT